MDLLKAALLPADQAKPAWLRWKQRGIKLEEADEASGRLFSRLWSNRDAAGIEAEDLTLIKGVYRQATAGNAVRLASALDMTQVLVEAGITVLFFKGAAMIAIAPEGMGLRRIADVDVLIPEVDVARAVVLLTAAGCEAKTGHEFGARIGVQHAWTATSSKGYELDLHWWAFKTAGDDRVMFETAREAALLGRPVLIPSTTESLVSAVANAFFNPMSGSPLRWIADALLLLAIDGDPIDWDALIKRSRRPGLTLRLASGLGFLKREFGAPVPAEALAELLRQPVPWQERGAYWAAVNDPRVGARLLYHLEQHRARRLHYPTGVPRDFLGHLAQATGAMTGKRRDVFERNAVSIGKRLAKGEPLLR